MYGALKRSWEGEGEILGAWGRVPARACNSFNRVPVPFSPVRPSPSFLPLLHREVVARLLVNGPGKGAGVSRGPRSDPGLPLGPTRDSTSRGEPRGRTDDMGRSPRVLRVPVCTRSIHPRPQGLAPGLKEPGRVARDDGHAAKTGVPVSSRSSALSFGSPEITGGNGWHRGPRGKAKGPLARVSVGALEGSDGRRACETAPGASSVGSPFVCGQISPRSLRAPWP